MLLLAAVVSIAQYRKSELAPPPPAPEPRYVGGTDIPDSVIMPSPVSPTMPRGYNALLDEEYAADLSDPSNIKTEAIYDPDLGMYVIHTRLGERDLVTPMLMTPDEYNKAENRRAMQAYFQERNAMRTQEAEKEPFNILDMNFALGPLEKVFGPGGVRLTTQGSIQMSMGVKSNKTDNPALSLKSRRKTYFDFDQKIQATIGASVGDKLKFNMTYNTDATFDFDSKNLKLAYEGKEDEIIKSIEAGNVSMTTGSSLIRGGTALFGAKAKLQFGKLTVTGLLSQQNSESKTINTQGGVQRTYYSIRDDEYDSNRHFFLAQYFYDNYDQFASKLPHVS
ncbi:MAG: cell surface protein SprA, partial [Muribaculaceae bacterium]|nr:cell surface protein SprA [Muribaculaceae bacterium]